MSFLDADNKMLAFKSLQRSKSRIIVNDKHVLTVCRFSNITHLISVMLVVLIKNFLTTFYQLNKSSLWSTSWPLVIPKRE